MFLTGVLQLPLMLQQCSWPQQPTGCTKHIPRLVCVQLDTALSPGSQSQAGQHVCAAVGKALRSRLAAAAPSLRKACASHGPAPDVDLLRPRRKVGSVLELSILTAL